MELILERIAKRKTYTIGKLTIAPHPLAPHPLAPSQREWELDRPNAETPKLDKLSGRGNQLPLPSGGGMGGGFFCDTLEPTWRDYAHGARKIKGCSAIPEGRYAVVITYSPKFETWLPLLVGDQKFNKEWSGVRIHSGNTSCDTEGCILVGQNLKKGMVLNSRIWLKRLIDKIVEAKGRGEAVWLTIK